MSDTKHTPTPLVALLERLRVTRYALSVTLTSEEIREQEAPTYGGKGTSRWLTEEEYSALCAALAAHDALVVALQDAEHDVRNQMIHWRQAGNENMAEQVKFTHDRVLAALKLARGES